MKNFTTILFVLWANILFAQSYGTYYQSAEGLKQDALKAALNNIIKGHTEYPYTAGSPDTWDMLKQTDKDPSNAANVILLYSGASINAAQEYNNGNGWTREHTWAKSRGDFGTENGPGTDAHHLRPEDNGVNSARNNRAFDNCITCEPVNFNGVPTGSFTDANLWTFEPRDAVKGDVARMIFYMATRYEGEIGEPDLELTENILSNTDQTPVHGVLSTLLEWNREDPVDDWERNRNEVIYTQFQNNRNPYIDLPDLVEYIWGNAVGLTWSSTFSTFPKDGEMDVSTNTTITYVFSEAMRNIGNTEITNDNVIDLLTLNETDATGDVVAFTATIDVNKKVITIVPSTNLKNSQLYYATLGPVEDASSTARDFTAIKFTTIEADLTAPAFTSNPSPEETGVSIFTKITLTFDEAIRNLDDSEITNLNVADLLILRENNESGVDVPFTAVIDVTKKIITATPTDNLLNSQVYYAAIGSVEDASNNANPGNNMTFTTSAANETANVIISQYYEGLSNDKYIEITNIGSETVDLSTYFLGRFSNTDAPADAAIYDDGGPLTGMITSGQTLVYKNPSAVNPAYAVSNSVASTTATFVNGDDPIALMNGGNAWGNRVDCIYASIASGTWGLDRSFYRKASVTTGNRNISVLDGSGEWTEVSLANVASASSTESEYLGVHLSLISGIDPIENLKINIYPNPSKGKFFVEVGDSFKSNAKIEVFNMLGMKVFETLVQDSRTELNLNMMKQGVYYVRVDDGKNVHTQKIIKQ